MVSSDTKPYILMKSFCCWLLVLWVSKVRNHAAHFKFYYRSISCQSIQGITSSSQMASEMPEILCKLSLCLGERTSFSVFLSFAWNGRPTCSALRLPLVWVYRYRSADGRSSSLLGVSTLNSPRRVSWHITCKLEHQLFLSELLTFSLTSPCVLLK